MSGAVIIGTGHGGFQAAVSLRLEGYDAPITLIGDEAGLPYQRPPLSKTYMKGADAAKLAFRPAEFFQRQGITIHAATRVTALQPALRQVHAGGRAYPYDYLILATGAMGALPPVPGIEHAAPLRNLADAERLRDRLTAPVQIVVIGGGFIGLEFAAMAQGLGHKVTVIETATRLMARAISAEMSQAFLDMHESLGVQIRLGAQVAEIAPNAVTLADGAKLPAGLVLVATGVLPATDLAAAAGLATDNGIAVDSQMRSSDPEIFAIGDCASFPDAATGRRIRLESVQAATDQARHVARVIAKGHDSPYNALPWFWSDQADWRLQIAGLARPQDESLALPCSAVLRFDGDRLSAVETVNDAKLHMKARRLLADPALPDRAALARVGYDLLQV